MIKNPANHFKTVSSVLFCLLYLFLLLGCNSSGNEKTVAQQLSFDVIDSLLGPVFEIEQANKLLYIPVGFEPIPDSLFESLKSKQKAELKGNMDIEMVEFFFDSLHNAGLIASSIKDLALKSDTSVFMENYRNSLIEYYGGDRIRSGEYLVNDIYVINFLITDSAHVRFQLICLSEDDHALELQYFMPNKSYPKLVKSIESSIGTIKQISKGE